MRNGGKRNVIGILIDAVDYEAALAFVFSYANKRRSAAISALAVHGVMTGALDAVHRHRLNSFDLLVPDGQPVRWVLNALYGVNLRDRVYGPNLTLKVCEKAAAEGHAIYFYGSTPEVLRQMQNQLLKRYPALRIAGAEPSKFRRLTPDEKMQISARIVNSGASITFVGLGCPRQEVFAFEFREALGMPVLAVGAAFGFIAGVVPQAPSWLQRAGLEWLFRLCSEPRRLWRRYLYLNPAYVILVALQAARVFRFPTLGASPSSEELFG